MPLRGNLHEAVNIFFQTPVCDIRELRDHQELDSKLSSHIFGSSGQDQEPIHKHVFERPVNNERPRWAYPGNHETMVTKDIIQQLRECKTLQHGRALHEHAWRSGYGGDILLQNLLIQMYGRCGCVSGALKVFQEMTHKNIYSWNILISVFAHNQDVDTAKLVFDAMPQKDIVSWNTLIAAYTHNSSARKAILFFRIMDLEGAKPNTFTFINALEACTSLQEPEIGILIHKLVLECRLKNDVVVATAILTMYGKCKRIEQARLVFESMRNKNVITWNAMLAMYTQNGEIHKAMVIFGKMPFKDVFTWTGVITALGQSGSCDQARRMFNTMPEKNIVSWNAMLAAYAQNGHLAEARALFDQMSVRNTSSWNSMISGYAQCGDEEGTRLFKRMDVEGVEMNMITLISTLNACASSSALVVGRAIHEHVVENGLVLTIVAETSLVNMYGKCGALVKAREMFDRMRVRNTVSWNTMMSAYLLHKGRGVEALEFFHEMSQEGVEMNDVTFTNVLTACSRVGTVDDGFGYFHEMVESYRVAPTCEHYVCVIDLLTRAGQAEEARELIESMPFEPHAVAWTMVLGACSANGDTRGGTDAVENAQRFEPDHDASHYLLLSNLHGSRASMYGSL